MIGVQSEVTMRRSGFALSVNSVRVSDRARVSVSTSVLQCLFWKFLPRSDVCVSSFGQVFVQVILSVKVTKRDPKLSI